MKVILHIGAHRCATRSFQLYLNRKSDLLSHSGIASLGPDRTRSGLLLGVQPGGLSLDGRDPMDQARGRITLQLQSLKDAGTKAVVVSDADMMGKLEHCFALCELYPAAGESLARLDHAFNSAVTDIMINIRGLEDYWASALAVRLEQSLRLPNTRSLAAMAVSERSWRDVITDVAQAMPQARIRVFPHEQFAGRPEAQLTVATGLVCPTSKGRFGPTIAQPGAGPATQGLGKALTLTELRADLPTHLARVLPTGNGRWMPFSDAEAAALRERYQDDLMWLAQGADGRAELVGDTNSADLYNNKAAAECRPCDDLTRGSFHDRDNGRLAGAG